MGCSCSIDQDYADPVELLVQTNPVAHKVHICDECEEEIPKGQKYSRHKYLFDGRFEVHKTCKNCLSVRGALFCSWIYGTLWESVEEEFQESDELPNAECMMELTKPARDKFCDLLEGIGDANDKE